MADHLFDKKKQNVVWPLFSFKPREEHIVEELTPEEKLARERKMGFD